MDYILQGSSYYRVVSTNVEDTYTIKPFDQNGNVIKNINVLVNREDAKCNIYLPLLSTLKGLSCSIVFTVEGVADKFAKYVNILTQEDSGDLITGNGEIVLGASDNAMTVTLVSSIDNKWLAY